MAISGGTFTGPVNTPLLNQINQATGFANTPAQIATTTAPATPPTPSSGGGGGGSASPYQSQYNTLTGSLQSQIGQLNNLYQQIFGSVDNAAQTQRGSLESGYANQFQTLQDQYGQNSRALPWQYAGLGLGSSSFADNAQTDAGNIYKDNVGQIQSNEDSSLQQLAGWAAGQKASAQAGQNWLGTLGTLMKGYGADASGTYGLANLLGEVNQQIQTASPELAQYQPGSQLMGQLNQMAPSQNQGVSQLQQQLQNLGQTSLPSFAKDQIASGVISKNTQQQPDTSNYWLNYYNNLTSPQTAGA